MCQTVQPDLLMMSDGSSIVPDKHGCIIFVYDENIGIFASTHHFTLIMIFTHTWLVVRQPKLTITCGI